METNGQERLKRRPRSILGRDPIKFKPSRLIPVAIEFFLDLNQNSPRGFRKPIMIYSLMNFQSSHDSNIPKPDSC